MTDRNEPAGSPGADLAAEQSNTPNRQAGPAKLPACLSYVSDNGNANWHIVCRAEQLGRDRAQKGVRPAPMPFDTGGGAPLPPSDEEPAAQPRDISASAQLPECLKRPSADDSGWHIVCREPQLETERREKSTGAGWHMLPYAVRLRQSREKSDFAPPEDSRAQLPPLEKKAAAPTPKTETPAPQPAALPACLQEGGEETGGWHVVCHAPALESAREQKGIAAAPVIPAGAEPPATQPTVAPTPVAETEPATEPELIPEIEPTPEPVVEPEFEPVAEPEPIVEPEPIIIPEREPEPEIESEPEAPRRKPRRALIAALLALAVIGGLSGAAYYASTLPPVVESVHVADELNDDLTVTLNVELKSRQLFNKDMWAAMSGENNSAALTESDWQKAQDGYVQFDINAGELYIYTKNARGYIGEPQQHAVEINEIISLSFDKQTVYMPLDGTDRFEPEIIALGSVDTAVSWKSSDENVVRVSADGTLWAIGTGEATITATTQNGLSATGNVIVSDLFQLPVIDNRKPIIPAYYYTEEQNDLLDAALKYSVDQAGYGTRSGPVAAARFLTMEFPWFIQYFYENGRLNNLPNRGHVDGEGRYYHIGLYLHESRYEDISATLVGPAIWGAPLTNFEDDGYFVPGQKYPNGLSCSGFVSWALLNGGFDVGDSGAGDYEFRDDDLCDLGERVPLTEQLMASGRVQVGDLIGEDGHIAIIIGFDDENIYIAESLGRGVRVSVLERYVEVVYAPDYDYVMLMDSVYGDDPGNLTDHWE